MQEFAFSRKTNWNSFEFTHRNAPGNGHSHPLPGVRSIRFRAIPHKLTARIQPEIFRRKKAVFRRNTLCISRKNNAFSAIKIGCSPMAHLCGVALSHISLVYQFSHEKAMKKWLRNPSADRMAIRRSRPEFPIFTAYFHRLLPKERKRPMNSLQGGQRCF